MKIAEGRLRVAISNVAPQVDEGRFSIKRIIGDSVIVKGDIFSDSHSAIAANLLFHSSQQKNWREVPMKYEGNDSWTAKFFVEALGVYFYTIQAWVDYFKSWQLDIEKKFKLRMTIKEDLQIGIDFLEEAISKKNHEEIQQFLEAIKKAKNEEEQVAWITDNRLSLLMRDRYPNKQWVTKASQVFSVIVDPPKARFSTWYEIFPRSFGSSSNEHGTFKDCYELLPKISKMGFDVLYFPPIHPIGYSKRKGKKNQAKALEGDPGSPWAVGSHEGGHQSIHPQLGSIEDFEELLLKAKEYGIDIALDIALQCSVDHPYLKEHPDWFWWRSDGTIQYAENPPKKYEDIVPFYFETKDWKALWNELRAIFLYWIQKGVRIFRVDNPHTKPFVFWEWLITTIKEDYPDVIFLSEAFTRPKVMYWLSKLGFTQSYTYFTWRHTKQELTDYLREIVLGKVSEYFRPNFWTNTPDILTEELQRGGKAVFMSRLILAATLSSNYGMYAPAFELMEREALPGSEEYLRSEKYELREWDWEQENLIAIITKINQIRKNHPALQHTSNLQFFEIDNEQILYYGKFLEDEAFLIFVNLDPFHEQSGNLEVPLEKLNLQKKGSYKVHELLLDQHYIWEGEIQRLTLNLEMPACIFQVEKKVRREVDFEYFL